MADPIRVLLVDDDERLLSAAKRVLRKGVDLVTALGGTEALRCLETDGPFAVVISDQNMPDMKGVALLAEVAEHWPTTVRIMLTGNDDQATAVAAVNDGQIFRFINKPCRPEDLLAAISQAAKHYQLLVSEKTLLEQTLSGSVKVLTDVLAVSRPQAFERSSAIQRWARRLSVHLSIDRPWELDLAAMLSTLGYVTLPDSVADKYFCGLKLNDNERALMLRVPARGSELIQNIPRMQGVAKAIYYSRKGYDGSGYPRNDVRGEDIPPISRLLNTLFDLAEATAPAGVSFANGVKALRVQMNRHDPAVLTAVEALLSADVSFTPKMREQRRQLSPTNLQEGDVTATDIVDAEGKLLLASGSTLTNLTIGRLKSLKEIQHLVTPIDVWRTEMSA